MTNENAVIERLEALFLECFHIEVPSRDTDLLESGVLDSLQFVELLAQLEQRFGIPIKVDDIQIDDLRTLRRIGGLVARNGGGGARAGAHPAAGAAG